MALDPNLKALITTDVQWFAKTGVDGDSNDTWAAPITLKCYPAYGSTQVERKDGSLYTSDQSLYFDGNDSHAQTFQLGDKFTSPGIAGGVTMEAVAIEANYSPGPSLNAAMSTWIVEVRL